MKNLKNLFAICLFMVAAFSASATCTVETSCGTYTYDVDVVSVSVSSSNGTVTIEVISDGAVIDQITCQGNSASVSTSCNGGADNGDNDDNGGGYEFDFCDYITSPFLKSLFGCE